MRRLSAAITVLGVLSTCPLQGDYTNVHIQRATAGQQPTDDKQVRVQAQVAF